VRYDQAGVVVRMKLKINRFQARCSKGFDQFRYSSRKWNIFIRQRQSQGVADSKLRAEGRRIVRCPFKHQLHEPTDEVYVSSRYVFQMETWSNAGVECHTNRIQVDLDGLKAATGMKFVKHMIVRD